MLEALKTVDPATTQSNTVGLRIFWRHLIKMIYSVTARAYRVFLKGGDAEKKMSAAEFSVANFGAGSFSA